MWTRKLSWSIFSSRKLCEHNLIYENYDTGLIYKPEKRAYSFRKKWHSKKSDFHINITLKKKWNHFRWLILDFHALQRETSTKSNVVTCSSASRIKQWGLIQCFKFRLCQSSWLQSFLSLSLIWGLEWIPVLIWNVETTQAIPCRCPNPIMPKSLYFHFGDFIWPFPMYSVVDMTLVVMPIM